MFSVIRTAALALLILRTMLFAVDPPPDDGYPNENTAEGEDALFSLPPMRPVKILLLALTRCSTPHTVL
jgi:hypothetical protein